MVGDFKTQIVKILWKSSKQKVNLCVKWSHLYDSVAVKIFLHCSEQRESFQYNIFSVWNSLGKEKHTKVTFQGAKHHHCLRDRREEQIDKCEVLPIQIPLQCCVLKSADAQGECGTGPFSAGRPWSSRQPFSHGHAGDWRGEGCKPPSIQRAPTYLLKTIFLRYLVVISTFSHMMSQLDFDFTVYLSQITDEGIFKAGAERSETRGAAEVQEDEDTQVEIPVDQVTTVPLKTCIPMTTIFISSFVLSALFCFHARVGETSQVQCG